MAIYTVLLPPGAAGTLPAAEKIVFLREGFSTPAFLFGPLWLMWKRAWLAAIIWTLLLALAAVVGWQLSASSDALSWLGLAFAVWLGFEGARLIAWTLARRGYVESDIVVGDDEEEAELNFFTRWRAQVADETLAEEVRA